MPGNSVIASQIREKLSNQELVECEGFSILQDLCRFVSGNEDDSEAQELVLRALEVRHAFGSGAQIVSALARQMGLFPYLEPATLSLADQIAYEVHRPANMDESIVFHRPQAKVYRKLLEGENVILSAPTSFGKSLIIDAAIASGKYANVLIVVPTIALIDETRRRLTQRFAEEYKIITHSTQSYSQKNILILTQERVVELVLPDKIDLFIVDEFYKLSPDDENYDNERCALLNQVVYQLTKKAKQFYMLGPNVIGLTSGVQKRLDFHTFMEDYHTVVSELHYVDGEGDDIARMIQVCKDLKDPTMIFCSSPNRATEVAKALIAAGMSHGYPGCAQAADWTAEHYDPEWHFVQGLRSGIGIHHGRIPRALAQFVVREFNSGSIQYLVCTSTLIEGVNTKAKNIVILDNRINKSTIDLFTFNNIRGRSGRMGEHFIGHVYLFHPPPQEELPLVDVPAFTQSPDTPESLLIQIDEEDLTDTSRSRLQEFHAQDILGYETLRMNVGVDPAKQLKLAQRILDDLQVLLPVLQWSGMPSSRQLYGICDLLWEPFGGSTLGSGSARTSKQLAFMINRMRSAPPVSDLIRQAKSFFKDADASVQHVLDFIRLWARFHFPKLLRALNNIQKDILSRKNLKSGDYEVFANQTESLFLPSEIIAIEEYGVPLETARKIQPYIEADGNLDAALAKLKRLKVDTIPLSEFERVIIKDAQSYI